MLTDQEKQLISMTAEIWNKFCELPVIHPNDAAEMGRDLHDIQHRIMARAAARLHPDLFPVKK